MVKDDSFFAEEDFEELDAALQGNVNMDDQTRISIKPTADLAVNPAQALIQNNVIKEEVKEEDQTVDEVQETDRGRLQVPVAEPPTPQSGLLRITKLSQSTESNHEY